MSDQNGVIYAVSSNGDLMWYRHNGRNDGSDSWASGGKKVGVGWSARQVFYGGDGIVYVIDNNNDLLWYRHDGRNDGTFKWTSNNGKVVGHGWSFKQVFYGDDGIIYAITHRDRNPAQVVGGSPWVGGDLLWYRHDGRNDGTVSWASGAKTVSHGWGRFNAVFSGDGGHRVYGAIGDRYSQLGGSDSWLGWPTSDEQDFPENGRVNTFENGTIYWWPDTGARDLNDVVLQYTGLHCFGETDIDGLSSSDEPYAALGVSGPDGTKGTFRSQIYEDVEKGEDRLEVIELYRGKPRGLVVSGILTEHSGGDTEASRLVVSEVVEKGGTALATAATLIPVVGPVLGPAAAAAFQFVKNDISHALDSFVENTLGFADRPLGSYLRELSTKEMVILATRPEGHAQQGPIPWRFETPPLERFGATYKVYFNIFAA